MKPAANSLAISSPMALRLSSSKRRSRYWTGLDPGKMRSSCSATYLGMPGMSDVFQAKVSLLARRKSTSACSYLADSWEPTRTSWLDRRRRPRPTWSHRLRRRPVPGWACQGQDGTREWLHEAGRAQPSSPQWWRDRSTHDC